MATFIEEIGRAVKQTACAVIATNDAVNGFLEGVGFPGAEAYADRTRALRRQLCNNDDDSVPTPPPPPLEQCLVNLGDLSAIGGVRLKRETSTGNVTLTCIRQLLSTNLQGPGDSQRVWRYLDCAGVERSFVQNLPPNLVTVNVTGESQGCCDGRTDSFEICSAPGPIPKYSPTTINIGINYQNNQNIEVNENVDITIFAPQINLIGGIFAPITISGNTFQLVGTVELSPEFKVKVKPNIDVSIGGGSPDDEPPAPVLPVPQPEIEPTDRVIVGAIVTVTSVDQLRQDFLPQDKNPDIAIPNLGYLSFYVNTQKGAAWTADIPIKNVRSYVPCPVTKGAVEVEATARPGVTLDVKAVWDYPGQVAGV